MGIRQLTMVTPGAPVLAPSFFPFRNNEHGRLYVGFIWVGSSGPSRHPSPCSSYPGPSKWDKLLFLIALEHVYPVGENRGEYSSTEHQVGGEGDKQELGAVSSVIAFFPRVIIHLSLQPQNRRAPRPFSPFSLEPALPWSVGGAARLSVIRGCVRVGVAKIIPRCFNFLPHPCSPLGTILLVTWSPAIDFAHPRSSIMRQ